MEPCEAPLRNVTRGVWRPLPSGDLQFDLQRCALRRFDRHAARRCLAGRHVVMLGQSWTRYMYMSLVHLLELGTLPAERPRGSVCWERSWAPPPNQSTPRWLARAGDLDEYGQQWAHFFHGTNALFSSAGGREVCDCSRPSMAAPHQENRFYERRAAAHHAERAAHHGEHAAHHDRRDAGGGANASTRVSFFFTVGKLPVHGFAEPSKAVSVDGIAEQLSWCEAGVCTLDGRGAAWHEKSLATLMARQVAPLQPDVLLWSSDFLGWPSCASDHGLLRTVLRAGSAALRPGGTALAKSRSFPQLGAAAHAAPPRQCFGAPCGGANERGSCMRERVASEEGWPTLDHFELLRALYAHNATVGDASFVEDDPNRAHHRCYVNNELVNLMLNMICG